MAKFGKSYVGYGLFRVMVMGLFLVRCLLGMGYVRSFWVLAMLGNVNLTLFRESC